MNNITLLQSVYNTLDTIKVEGYDNHYKLVACMNDIRRVIEELSKSKGVEEAEEAEETVEE